MKKHYYSYIVPAMILFAGIQLPACASKPGPLGERTIELDDFDFSTSISEILPECYKDPEYGDDFYLVPSSGFGRKGYGKETYRDLDTNEALWIEYRWGSVCSTDEYLSMAGRICNAANFATTLDGRIFVASGYIDELTQAENDDFIAQLSKRYGEPVHTEESFCSDYDLYTWTLEDRTIKYAVVTTNESNALIIELERNETGDLTDIHPGERRTYLQGRIFVIDAAWRDRFLASDLTRTGDFVYCK
ncbi:hypothetical protein [Alistipes sp. D31t1_170403_E11]|uniref:hypothetical protein n=1 Tax=Alistipes sp. D31t1_170403_E11 TaxID=2787128 RepID=UPI00189AAFC3|nr:hypothetical protein [Alistipes sp. D31t1_170403_E11]